MAQFMNMFHQADIIDETESDMSVNDEIQTDALSYVRQNIEQNEIIHYRVSKGFKEKFKLLRLANELYEISRMFLPQKFTLLDIKNDEHNDLIASMLKENMNYMHEIDRMFELEEITTNVLKFKLVEIKKDKPDAFIDYALVQQMNYFRETLKTFDERRKTVKIIEVEERSKDMTKIVEETFDRFSKFLEVYKKCSFYIADTFYVAAKQRHVFGGIENLFDSIIALEAHFTSYKGITKSSKKASDKNKSSKIDSEMTKEEFCDKIDLLIAATEKAEFAYFQIKTLVYELISNF